METEKGIRGEAADLADKLQNIVSDMQDLREAAEAAGMYSLANEIDAAVGDAGSAFSKLLALSSKEEG